MISWLTVLSANCQGLQDYKKRYDVINYLKKKNPAVICLQDTHLITKDEYNLRSLWGNDCYVHGKRTNARGVATLINNNFEYDIRNVNKEFDDVLIIDLRISDIEVRLINIYAPNNDSPIFFQNIEDSVKNNPQDYVIICGDYNLVLNPTIDCFNYINVNNPNARNKVLALISEHSLLDAFRYFNVNKRKYTWKKRQPVKQARLDYCLISRNLSDLTANCYIIPGYRSDHAIVKLDLLINKFKKGKGIWKFNINWLKY